MIEDAHNDNYEVLHEDDYNIQDDMINAIAFKASGDKDTMYFHQVMRMPGRDKFCRQ